MKKLQQFCAVVVLALVFTVSVSAGEMSGPGLTNPPLPPPQFSATGDSGMPGASATGEISTSDVVALDPVTEAALSLLQSILSIF